MGNEQTNAKYERVLKEAGIELMGPEEDKEMFAKLLTERGRGDPRVALAEMKPGEILDGSKKKKR